MSYNEALQEKLNADSMKVRRYLTVHENVKKYYNSIKRSINKNGCKKMAKYLKSIK